MLPKQAKHGPDKGSSRRSFGRIRKRPSKRYASGFVYQVGYTGPDTATHYAPTTFQTKMDAEGWLRDESRLIERDEWTPPADRNRAKHARGTTLEQYAEAWLPRHRRPDGQPLKARTIAHYRKLLDSRILPELGDLEAKKITEAIVTDWHHGLGTDTPTYTAHAYSLLHLIMKSAEAEKIIAKNPCTIRGATQAKTVHRVEPATIAEIEIIVANMLPKYRLAILLMAWCALRFGEVTELRRSDIDIKRRNRIHVQRGVVLVDGDRQVTTPKSDAGVRWVSIPPHLIKMIKDHLSEHVGPRPDDLLFTARDGGHLSQSTLNGKKARVRRIKGRVVKESASGFQRAAEAAGRPDLRLHDLRHSGAVLAAQTGATLKELMERLGHSTPSAALRYQHAAKDRDAQIAELLSKMAEGK